MKISTRIGTDDYKLFVGIINQGIDSKLEAFTKLKHEHKDGRLIMKFHKSELPILIRRLEETGDEHAEQWAEDIKNAL